MSLYTQEKVLSDEEIQEAIDLSKSLKWKDVYQQYNLFHVKRADLEPSATPPRHKFIQTMANYVKKMGVAQLYFLRYVPGSFTRLHHDDGSEITTITLLGDDGLKGGHSLVVDRYDERESDSPDELKQRTGHEFNNPPFGEYIVPEVVPIVKGETLSYGEDLIHGVSKVLEGERLVLVMWFKDRI